MSMCKTVLGAILLAAALVPSHPGVRGEDQPSLSQLRSSAQAAMQARRFSEATRLLTRITEHDPEDGETWLRLGLCHLKRLRYKRAIEALQQAFHLDHEPAETSFRIAFAYARRRHEKKALEWLETSAALGFNRLSEARTSSAFLALRDAPEFDRILLMIEKNQNPCEHSAGYSQLDFWLGDWEVYTPAGSKAGENRIEKTAGGCLLLEDWKSVSGGTGRSMTFYHAGRDKWRQVWVDRGGSTIEAEGSFAHGKLRLEGVHTRMGGGSEKCLITLELLPDGRVHQKIEQSHDGTNWYVWFEGMYVRPRDEADP